MKKYAIALFLITRIFALFFMPQILSDTIYYATLAQKMLRGFIPYIDYTFEYPPLSIIPIYLPGLISLEHYRMIFMILALIVDCFIFWKILKESKNALFYVFLSSFLMPFYFERIDIFMILPMIYAVHNYTLGKNNTGIFWSTIAGWLKLIPFITYIGIFKDFKNFPRSLTKIIILNLLVLTICSLLFYGNMLDFLKYHLNRPFQIESVAISVFFALSYIFDISFTKVTSFGSQNIEFLHQEYFLKGTSITLFFIFCWLSYFYYKHKSRINLYDLTSVFILFLMIFSKVLSDQFFIWPLALIFLGSSIHKMNFFDKAVLALAYLGTGFLFINYTTLIKTFGIWPLLLILKNACLVYITFRLFYLLKKQTRTV